MLTKKFNLRGDFVPKLPIGALPLDLAGGFCAPDLLLCPPTMEIDQQLC